MSRPPLPPFTDETAKQKARLAEDAWNSRDPTRVALAYTTDSQWRNRAEFLQGREAIAAHEAGLTAYAHERLGAINSLRIFGTAPGKGPIVSFAMEGTHAHDIATLIDRSGVAERAGTHCAMPLLQRFGVTSTCRASFALYNTRAEIDVLADALVRAHKLFQ